ncbi:hypothetical protein V8G54_019316 [Vigna mungo]|uniref:Uncharacterized protein n=1 Tax=Vigna mungo TaxID=3915 RepID=A0AAQ3N9R9_VIGMU
MSKQAELLQDIKKGKKFSEEGEYLDNDEEKKEERCPQGSKPDEEPFFPWVEGVELSTIEGNGTQGQTTRAADVFEVQNIKGSTKIHPTINNMKENAVQGRSMLFESWTVVTQIRSVIILRENLKVDGATAESVVAMTTDEVRDVNLRVSQNWAKRFHEEWKSLEEDLSYRPPPKPPDLKLQTVAVVLDGLTTVIGTRSGKHFIPEFKIWLSQTYKTLEDQ